MNGLVGAYSFDAGTGTSVADSSGSANTGTLSGATWVTGKTGKALSFDGVNDWVTIGDSASLDLSGAMTLEAWVKPSGGGWRTVAFKERPSGLAYALYSSTNNGRPSAEVRTSATGGTNETRGPAALSSGTWSHLATTYNGSTLRLYVNGAQVSSKSVTGAIVNTSGPLHVGGNAVWSEWFSGQIDDLRVYNRALTAAELQTDMNTPVGGTPPPPPPPPPPPADSQAPTAPAGLTAGGQTETQITLNWTASSDNVGVTGYSRYQNGTLISSGTGTSFSFTGLTCGTSYTLAVDSYDAAGNRSTRPSTSASTLPCASGAAPVAAYSFDSATGATLTDNSGSGNTGSISGATWTSAGKSGGALAFDGVNDIVTVADKASLDLSSAMTLEAWIRPSANSTWRTIVTKETSGNLTYGLFSNSDVPQPSAIVSIGANPLQDITRGPTEVAMSSWTHLASTYDGAVLRLYADGTEVSTKSVTGAMANSAGPLQIGGNNVWAEWFQGQIDDLRIYNRALTPSQLQTDMNTPVAPPPAGDTQAPSAPAGLAVGGQTQNALTLSWNAATDNVGVTGYSTYRNSAAAGSTPSGTSTYTYSSLSCGTTYALAVDAVDAAGNRSAQASINGTTSACSAGDTQAPSTPAGLVVSGQTQTALTLSWNTSTDNVGVTGYNTYRNSAAAGTTAPATRTYTYIGLTCGTAYSLAVDAVDAAGNRSAKATASGTTSACSPPPPPPPAGTINVAPGGNLDAAYSQAQNGWTIQLAAGDYGIWEPAGGSKLVTIKGVPGTRFRQLNSSFDNIVFDGLDIDAGGVKTSGGAVFESNGDNATFKNGRIGNVTDEKAALISGSNFTFDNVVFHDAVLVTNGVHMECVYAIVVPGFTVRNSTFHNCAVMDLFFTYGSWWSPLPPTYGNVTVENNRFESSRDNNGACCHYYGLYIADIYSSPAPGTMNGWKIRNNWFENDVFVSPNTGSNNSFCGNTGKPPSGWSAGC